MMATRLLAALLPVDWPDRAALLETAGRVDAEFGDAALSQRARARAAADRLDGSALRPEIRAAGQHAAAGEQEPPR